MLQLCECVYCMMYNIILLTHAGPRSGTAESIFAKMNDVFQRKDIPWANCVGIGVDNTSVNLGKSNSIMTRVLQTESSCILSWVAPCHIVHNMAMKASGCFTVVS